MATAKLFVGGLAWGTDSQSLQDAFGKFGEVVEARVVTDKVTGRSKGFGFVSYNTTQEAEEAVNQMNGQDLDGRQIRCDFAQDKEGGSGGGFRGGDRDSRGGGGRRGGPYDAPRRGGGGRGGFRGGRGGGGFRGGRRDDGPRERRERDRDYDN